MRGFMESRIMLTALELDLFSAIGIGATAAQAAKTVKAHPRSTEAVLNALAALKLLTKNGEVFYNTPLTARYLVRGAPDDSRLAMMHMVHLWHRWSTLTDAVKKGTAVAKEALKKRGKDQTAAFIAAMHKNASFGAKTVVPRIDLAGVHSLLDVGGGSGAYAIAFARKKPGMKVTVFDLPGVIPLTQKYIAAADLTDAIRTQAGDMTKDKLGAGYDLVLVSAICHMFSPKENLALFRRIKSALNPGGRIVIQDFVLEPDKVSPRFAAVFALNMLVNTRGGSCYSGREYLDWLEKAGFAEGKIQPLPGPTKLVIGKKP
jgi:cyclopropane fatty-acyl-phospholipid synthase-like methyltransferase